MTTYTSSVLPVCGPINNNVIQALRMILLNSTAVDFRIEVSTHDVATAKPE